MGLRHARGRGRVPTGGRWLSAALLVVLAMTAGACSSGDTDDADAPHADPTTTTTAPERLVEPVDVRLPPDTASGPANASLLDLGDSGYTEEEFFFDGHATSYDLASPATSDGQWDAVEAATAAFTSRLLVRRPENPEDFSGVVLVEWLNVSGGVDGDPDWGYNSDEIIREGHAWVGVSAQRVGVTGSPGSVAGPGGALVNADPERYGDLDHPGDDVRLRHLHPGRPCGSRARRSRPPRAFGAVDDHRHGRVPVGDLPQHLRQRRPGHRRALRRVPRPQPRRSRPDLGCRTGDWTATRCGSEPISTHPS